MSVRTLLGHLWRRHRLPLVSLSLGIALFEWAMTRAALEPAVTGAIRDFLTLAPPPVQRLFGEEIAANLSPRGFLGFGYVHPFPLLMMSVWIVRVSAGSLAGEIGRGTMDLIASRPVARWAQVLAAVVALFGGLFIIIAAAWTGTAWGLAGRPLEGATATAYLPVVGSCWLLFASFGAVGLLVSAARRDGGSAIAWSAGLLSASFVLDYLARVWPRIASLRPFSLFQYYQPQRILREGVVQGDVVVLVLVGFVALVAAFGVFARRDL